MKCDHKIFILLLSFAMYLILKVESKHDNDITLSVITGDNVTANFTFQHSGINSPSIILNLYKNETKIGNCKQTNKNCSERFVIISDVEDNNSATLYIINITSEDKGKYYITVFVDNKPSFSSNKISFTVKPRDTTNENSTTSMPEIKVNDSPKPEETSVQNFIYIIASILFLICIFVGLLCLWIHRTCSRKPATDNPQAQSNSTTQGDFGRPGGVSVSCVEYGELDFQNRPARDDRGVKPAEVTSKDQDGVEYAAIIFPQQQQTPGGRIMRDNQRVHPVTR